VYPIGGTVGWIFRKILQVSAQAAPFPSRTSKKCQGAASVSLAAARWQAKIPQHYSSRCVHWAEAASREMLALIEFHNALQRSFIRRHSRRTTRVRCHKSLIEP
jgi:hypothetical protein